MFFTRVFFFAYPGVILWFICILYISRVECEFTDYLCRLPIRGVIKLCPICVGWLIGMRIFYYSDIVQTPLF